MLQTLTSIVIFDKVALAAAAALAAAGALTLAFDNWRLRRSLAVDRDRLRQSEENHRSLVERSPQISWVANAEGQLVEISPRWAEIIGKPVDGTFSSSWTQYTHPDDLPRTIEAWKAARGTANEIGINTRCRLRCADGNYRWFRARARPRHDEQGKVVKWYGTIEDINDQVRAEQALRASEERYRLASRATNDVIWDWVVDRDRIEWSDAVETVLGYPEAKRGTPLNWWVERLHPEEKPETLAHLERVLAGDVENWAREYRFRTNVGEYIDVLSRGHVVRDESGKPLRMIGAMLDMTARKRSEDELRWAATHDPLTQLPNRKLFELRLAEALEEAAQANGCVGLMVLDVDGFKLVNDTHGHLAGDSLLRELASRLTQQVPSDATVARLGGDELAIILPCLAPEEVRGERLAVFMQKMNAPLVYEGHQISISTSVGAAMFPQDGENAEALLKSADLALYAAKADGATKVRKFDLEMRQAHNREQTMLLDSREALSDDRIVPFYQPKICLRSGRIIGFEALLRWHHHRRGLQPPAELAAAFADGQLAVQLTDRMLDRTIADMALWLDQGCEFEKIAINGSAEDFRRGDFADRILGRLSQAQVPPTRLELEVTETVFFGKQSDETERTLHRLREAGVTIALDDFGTGYASLTHLKQFPVDTIKIDRSFVSRLISTERDDAIIVGALIDLAKNLGINSVAEGVETELQAHLLRSRGCDAGQGYFFERPIPASRLPGFVATWDVQGAPVMEGSEVKKWG